jgi:hypothetical protein
MTDGQYTRVEEMEERLSFLLCRSIRASERCDRMKSMYRSSSDTRNEPYQRRVQLFDANREPAMRRGLT